MLKLVTLGIVLGGLTLTGCSDPIEPEYSGARIDQVQGERNQGQQVDSTRTVPLQDEEY